MMNAQATPEEIANVMAHVRDRGYRPIELPGADRLAIGVLGSNASTIQDAVAALPGVLAAIPVSKPYKMVGLEWHPQRSVVQVGGVRIGDGSATPGKRPFDQLKRPESTTTPPIEVPCPPMNLVAEWTTRSAPHSKGRQR